MKWRSKIRQIKAIQNVTKVECQKDTSVPSVITSSNERTQEEESLNEVMAFTANG